MTLIKTGKTQAPDFQKGKSNALQMLVLRQAMQGQKEKQGTESLGEGAIPTKATGGSVTLESPQGQEFEARKKLRETAFTNAQKATLALGELDSLDESLDSLFGDIKDVGGVEGQQAVMQKFVNGVQLKNDPEYAALYKQIESKIPIFSRSLLEVGNLAEREQAKTGKALPIIGPNKDITNFFLPDDPLTAKAKIKGLRKTFMTIVQRNLKQAQEGDIDVSEFGGGEQVDTKSLEDEIRKLYSYGE